MAIAERNSDNPLESHLIGILVIIICLDGKEFETEICEIENYTIVSGVKGKALLIKGFEREDVPIGSEVFKETDN